MKIKEATLRKHTSPRIGTADLILGIIAVATHILHKGRDHYIALRDLCNILHDLQMEKFPEELKHLDFDRMGGNSWSPMLENILFQASAWGFCQHHSNALGSIYVDTNDAEQYLEGLAEDYPGTWPAVRDKISEIALVFVDLLRRKP